MNHDIGILVNLAVSLVLALVLGLITERFRLSPIVGYLLAGFILGPHSPGIRADPDMARQFAEVGVVLLMFGVGLQFHLHELWEVRRIAVPGAVVQVAVAATLGTLGAWGLGWPLQESLAIGAAVSVASTVVLVRGLSDTNALDSPQGRMAVGWLVVEDIFAVVALVALPAVASLFGGGEADGQAQENLLMAIGVALVKIVAVAVLVLGVGQRIIPRLLAYVAGTRSRELFTLCVLALALAIAVGSSMVFGVSMALGAFLAGMVVGQSEVSHQAAADALPMRDAFAVLFFVSVGMLFNPNAIVESPALLALLLAVVMLATPLTTLAMVWVLGYSWRSALTLAVGLAQVGEFSFLLADEARRNGMMPDAAGSTLVACALITITLNPLLFRLIDPIENWFRRRPRLWKLVNKRSEAEGAQLNEAAIFRLEFDGEVKQHKAVIIGYGPVGQTAARILRDFDIEPIVIDLNIDTVRNLAHEGMVAVYGDATRRDILEAASIRQAKYLLVTVPDVLIRTLVLLAAKDMNPDVQIFVRARYIRERAWLEEVGASAVCTEEAETAAGLATLLLRKVGADEARIQAEIRKLEEEYGVQRPEGG